MISTGSASDVAERVSRTVALVRRRGYALPPEQLGPLCAGGPIDPREIRAAVAASHELRLVAGLVLERDTQLDPGAIQERRLAHQACAGPYVAMALRFVRVLVGLAPFIRSVSLAGSLASGGFRVTDDVDLNLVVDDGKVHLAYVALNALGVAHALKHRGKAVDDLTRRPLAPRLMTANLILEVSETRRLRRVDEDMAFELLLAQTVYGPEHVRRMVASNPGLLRHFPQLAGKGCAPAGLVDAPRSLPAAWFPRALDGPARLLGEGAWRYMQWTRRGRPQALDRVAYVRSTMRPYTLFERSC